ncbi:MAG: arsenate reductase ArsC [Thermoplasmata archaeon]|nr:MAG: arsenate reductase ArsC [Thermoplasmata archaeon]
MTEKKKVLFICENNSVRSQMAEAFLNHLYGEKYEGYSTGIKATNVNPHAIKVMAEIGIDMSKQHSKDISKYAGNEFDYVVTVCDEAREKCPFFPGKIVLHKRFDNPLEFKGSDEEVINKFRRLRDEIKEWIDKMFGD